MDVFHSDLRSEAQEGVRFVDLTAGRGGLVNMAGLTY